MACVSVLGGSCEAVTIWFPVGHLGAPAKSLADDYTGGRLPIVSSGDEEVVIRTNDHPLILPKQATGI